MASKKNVDPDIQWIYKALLDIVEKINGGYRNSSDDVDHAMRDLKLALERRLDGD